MTDKYAMGIDKCNISLKKIWPELELNSHVRTTGGSRDPGKTIRSLSGGFNSGQSGYGLEHGRSSA